MKVVFLGSIPTFELVLFNFTVLPFYFYLKRTKRKKTEAVVGCSYAIGTSLWVVSSSNISFLNSNLYDIYPISNFIEFFSHVSVSYLKWVLMTLSVVNGLQHAIQYNFCRL